MSPFDEDFAGQSNADHSDTPNAGAAIVDPSRMNVAGSACSYNEGGLTCGCPGYVNDGEGYCRTCSHSGSFHW